MTTDTFDTLMVLIDEYGKYRFYKGMYDRHSNEERESNKRAWNCYYKIISILRDEVREGG